MKKLYMTLAAYSIVVLNAFSQSQRTVLIEEFTNASCGPCAAQNPTFNTLLAANTAKVIPLKYQWDYPGYDPMNAQNPTEVDTRIQYYNESGVPTAFVDGKAITDDCGYYSGAPACLSQAEINTAYAVVSPFDMSVTHSFSADYDSVFITANITCTQATSGTLVAHLAITEKTITFTSAPGSNGEKVFYNVMRKMLPSTNGTSMAASWSVSQTQTITIGAPIPLYIYDLNQLEVVGFIQNNTGKKVLQAAMSSQISLPASTEDAGISSILTSSVPYNQCIDSIKPNVSLRNYSSNTLTSAVIQSYIDGNLVASYNWSGTLAPSSTASVTLPAIYSLSQGSHNFTVNVTLPNGGNDWKMQNNYKERKFIILPNSTVLAPVTEDFTNATFPPNNWTIDNPTSGTRTWERSTTNGGAAKEPFYNIASGEKDDMILEKVNLTTSTDDRAVMRFKRAYRQYDGTSADRLQIFVSTNCGASWSGALYSKSGSTLATGAATTSNFTPSAGEWTADSVLLTSYLNQTDVLIKLVGTSDYGNNLYIDDINILTYSTAVGIDEKTQKNSVEIYPNPFSTITNLEINLFKSDKVKVEIFNMVGQVVKSIQMGELNAGEHIVKIDAADLDAGVYFVNVSGIEEKITKKITITK